MLSRTRVFLKSARYALALLMLGAALTLITTPGLSGAAPLSSAKWDTVRHVSNESPLTQMLGLLPLTTWSPNIIANTDATGNGQHEPSLAVSPANPNVVAIANKDYRDQNIKRVWIEVSRDGGQTWPTQLHMPNLPTTDNESDPVVMARDDGRIYVSCLTTGNNGVFITWTDDNGLTWQPSVPIIQNQSALQDKDWFAVDNNPASPYYHRMYMAWAPGGVVSSYSTNGGLNWSTPQQIPNSGGGPIEYPYPVVAPNGDVFLFHMYNWGNRNPNPSIVKVVKSTDGGVSWSQPTIVATIYQPPLYPRDQWRFYSIISAAADPTNNNRLYAAWTDDRNHSTNGMEVMYSASIDHGATWGAITRLSHDPVGVVRDHITPMLDVSTDGRLHALWLDRRLDSANHLFQAWYTSSTDGGGTWEADSQVSDAPGLGFDLNVGLPPGSGQAAGDYWGLDTAGGNIYTAWTDTRDANQDIYTSRGTRASGSPTPTATGTPPTVTSTRTNTPVAPTNTNTPTRTNTPLPPTNTNTPTGPTNTPAPPTNTPTGPTNTPAPPTSTNTPGVATATATPCAVNFSDVPPSDPFYTYIRYLYCAGVISGYNDGTFRPGNPTTRGQLTKIVVLARGWSVECPVTGHFSDVPVGSVFYCFVETAYGHGIISGYNDGTFRPGNNVTRAQLTKIVVIAMNWTILCPALGHFSDVTVNDPFYCFIETAYAHGIISGYDDGTFRPGNSATRAQICKIVYLAVTNP